MNETKNILKDISEFYREVLGAWKEFLLTVVYKPEGMNEFLNHPLFLNSNSLYEDKELYLKKWIVAGIIKVKIFCMRL